MRSFALVILDNSDTIIDRFNLSYVDGLKGLGFQLDLSKIETDVEDYITKIVQKRQAIGFTIHHLRGYVQGDYLKLWIAKHINECLCLEYNNGNRISYVEGKIVEVVETELTEFRSLEQQITFQPTTPFFEKINNDVLIKTSEKGKNYPLVYPYCYGTNQILNNEITNNYITEIPVIVKIYGAISNPIITLSDTNNIVYNEIRFDDVDLHEGETLIINSAQKKVIFNNGVTDVDYYYKLNGAYDSYLRAKPLATSKIAINLQLSDSGYLVGSRRQYRL